MHTVFTFNTLKIKFSNNKIAKQIPVTEGTSPFGSLPKPGGKGTVFNSGPAAD